MIYFDNAATTFPKPQCVYDAINEGMKNYSFNAGRGSYKEACNTFKMIDDTRKKIASLIDCDKDNIIFTSSATESLNNIIYGLEIKKGDNVYVSPFEHNAIIRTLTNCEANILIIPFDKNWDLIEDKFNDMLILNKPKAVFISHISNVTGFMIPYEKIFSISKKHKCINILDSAQAFGIFPVIKENVDFVVFAGHKSLYAMFGIAGYININGIKLKCYKVGGTGSDSLNPHMPDDFPSRYEAGSLNSVGIYSMNCSIDFLKKAKFDIIEEDLAQYFIKKAKEIAGLTIFLPKNVISHGIVSFALDGYTSDEIGMIFGMKRFWIDSG